MTIHFPDLSPFQGGIALSGAPAALLKCTEGTGWSAGNWFTAALGRARAAGAFPMAYHFLHAGNAAGQAAWCNARDGGLPLMLDFEPSGSSRPGVGDAAGFIDAYRHGGGVCNLLYLPRWYWQQIGSPSLKPFTDRKMALVASAYPGSYSDHGSGWSAYGGMDVTVWQWTDKHAFHGQNVDFNAYKGTLDQLKAIATRGAPAGGGGGGGGDPTIRKGDKGAAVSKCQARCNVHGARPPLAVDGDFGQRTHDVIRGFQGNKKLKVDGVVGPATWAQLNKAPATPPPAAATRADPNARPWHGEWVSAGQASLAGLARNLGYPVNTLVRMTAVHYKYFEGNLAGYIAGLADGTVKPTDNLPAGSVVWCD
jgi:peptidoglycan hydrolase-like protein with peptidoglycan-binding domain